MSLVKPTDVRAVCQTSLSDADLQSVIDREEAEVVKLCGPHYVDADTSFTVTMEGGLPSLWFRRPLSDIVSITEDDEDLSKDEYRLWPEKGRIQRLEGKAVIPWGGVVTVEYIPADDNDLRASVIIELVRLALEREALRSESVAGEYNYTAPDWEKERYRLIRRLRGMGV